MLLLVFWATSMEVINCSVEISILYFKSGAPTVVLLDVLIGKSKDTMLQGDGIDHDEQSLSVSEIVVMAVIYERKIEGPHIHAGTSTRIAQCMRGREPNA